MNKIIGFSNNFYTALLVLGLGLMIAPAAFGDELFAESELKTWEVSHRSYVAGIERAKFSSNFKVTGWRAGSRAFFGRTKIAGEYAVGFVFASNTTVYGVTNRGVKVTRYF